MPLLLHPLSHKIKYFLTDGQNHKNAFLVLKQVVITVRVFLISSGLYCEILLYYYNIMYKLQAILFSFIPIRWFLILWIIYLLWWIHRRAEK